MLADSNPMIATIASAVADSSGENATGDARRRGATRYDRRRASAAAISTTANSGSSLSAVVTTWNRPAALERRVRLSSVSATINRLAVSAWRSGVAANAGQELPEHSAPTVSAI